MASDRLADLHLLPPPTMSPWRGQDKSSTQFELQRTGLASLTIDVPLFWYAPDWYLSPSDLCGPLATSVARLGVLVAALRSEIAGCAPESSMHDQNLPRIVPYRPERYGLQATDFDGASIIDLRLTLARDPSGRFAFPAEQVARWEADSGKSHISGGSWVDATSFPPDVENFEHLGGKIAQLRSLSPNAYVFVSIQPVELETELPDVLDADPDGVILRLDRYAIDGLRLASVVQKTRALMDGHGSRHLPLWIVPGEITSDDAAKLIALGASAIAIDTWCHELRTMDMLRPASAAERLGLAEAHHEIEQEYVDEVVHSVLHEQIDRFQGLVLSIAEGDLPQRLGTFEPIWAESLGLRLLG